MKRYHYIWIVIIALTMSLWGCKDDDDIKAVNITITNAVYESGDISAITVKEDNPLQLEAFIMPTNTTNQSVSYKIAGTPTGAISITEDGLVTPLLVTPETGGIPNPLGVDTIVAVVNDGSGVFVRYPVRVVSRIVLITSITVSSEGQMVNLETGKTFDLARSITINPADATDRRVIYSSSDELVAEVDASGMITAIGEGDAVITITAADGSGAKAVSTVKVVDVYQGPVDLDRSKWQVTLSHMPLVTDATVNPAPGNINAFVDGNNNTCIVMVKPGKSLGGVSPGSTDDVYFVIDMGASYDFSYFRLRNRNVTGTGTNSSVNLRVMGCSVYGSNDGTDYTPLSLDVDIPYDGNQQEVQVDFPESNYRYFKFQLKKWSDSGNSVQISEFYLGYII